MKKLLWSAAVALLFGGSAMAVDNGVERYVGPRKYAIPPSDVPRAALIGDSVSGTKMGGSTTLYMVSVVLNSDGTVSLSTKDVTGASASTPVFVTNTGTGGFTRADQGQANSGGANAWPVSAGLLPSASLGIDSSRNTVQAGLLPSASVGIDSSRNTVQAGLLPSASVGIDSSRNTVQAGLLPSASVGIDSSRNSITVSNSITGVRANGDGVTTTEWSVSVTVANGATVSIPSGAVAVTIKIRPGGTTTAFVCAAGTMAYAASAMGDAIFHGLPYTDLARVGNTETIYLYPQDNETLIAHVWIKLNGCQCATQ